jgi:hypothetical protein
MMVCLPAGPLHTLLVDMPSKSHEVTFINACMLGIAAKTMSHAPRSCTLLITSKKRP